MEISKFYEKLNKLEGNIYTFEEEITVENGVYESELQHDNINPNSLNIYTGSQLTGEKIESYALSTPSKTPWKMIVKIFTLAPKVYISYETSGDTVEAEDVNRLQDSMIETQGELNKETERAKQAEEVLSETLKTETDRAEKAEEVLSETLKIETERAKQAEGVLTETLKTETERAEKAEEVLSETLKLEVDRAKTVEQTLGNDLSLEVSRAKKEEKTLTDQLGIEVSRALAAENGLETKKADQSTMETELNNRYTKDTVYTKMEVLEKIEDVVGAAPEALDTLKEIALSLNNDADFAGTMTTELSKKAEKTDLTIHSANKANPHEVTKAQVGLGKVPNVTTNDQTPTYNESKTLADLTSGEPLTIAFGKIKKAVQDFSSHLANSFNPHGVTKSQIGLGNVENKTSETIRGEITKANVTTALGYTPPTVNTTYGIATNSVPGLIKNGTDITIDTDGNVSVKDDSHSHVVSNVDGLQGLLEGKAASSHGTHVTYGSTTSPLTSGGTGVIGTAVTVSRSDHTHTLPAYPTKTSQLSNDSGYLTSAQVDTSQNHIHTNKLVLDKIVQESLENWNHSYSHSSITTNPHKVTKAQLGLENVENTADVSKPVSTAVQTALNNKVDKVTGKGLSSHDYTDAEKTKLTGIAANANQYVHPNDANTRHVTDTEKTAWNGKAASNHNHDSTYLKKTGLTWGDLKGV